MAGIDYTIPGQFKGIQLESPMNAMAQAMQLRNLQESSQMNALKFQEAQREAQERNALAKLDPSSPEYIAQLTRINPKLGVEFAKAKFDSESAKLTQEKHRSDLFLSKLKESRSFLEGFDVNSPTAANDYIAWAKKNLEDPVLGPVLAQRGVTLDSTRARVAQAIQSGTLNNLVNESKLGIEKFYELTPAFNKAEKEQIDQEYSDYLNTPGNPSLTRLQFIEARKRQRAAAPAPAPAPDAVVAPADLLGNDPNMVVTKEPVDSQGQNRPPFNKTGPLGNKVAYTDEAAAAITPPVVQPARDDSKIAPAFITGANNLAPAVNGRLPSIMWPEPNVNNLGTVPTFTTAGANKVAPQVATAPTAKTADITAQPAIHPQAALLMQSTLQSDKDKAAIIQRRYEDDLKRTEKQRDYAVAVEGGFKGTFPQWLDQQRETENEREYRRAKERGEFKGTFTEWRAHMAKAMHITVQTAPGVKPTDTALDMLAYQYIQDKATISTVPKQLRMAVTNRAAEILTGQGLSAEGMAGQVITNQQDTAAAKAVIKDFTSGKAATGIRALNTAVDHLTTLDQTITALQNKDTRVFNLMGNAISKEMGYSAPTDFESVKVIVGSEVAKAVAGANMALRDREEIRDALSKSNSPDQLRGAIKRFKQLMAGQLSSYKTQYESSTSRTDFANKLSAEARRELGINLPRGKPMPKTNAKGWVLHTDSKGNKAYVSPDGKQFEEVK